MMRRALIAALLVGAVLASVAAAQVVVGRPAAAQAAAAAERGREAFWQGDFAAAAAAYGEAVEAAPDNPELWYDRGTAEARAGRPGPAIHAFEQALLLAPAHDDAAHNLAVVRQWVVDRALSARGGARSILPGEDDVGTGLLTALSPRTLGLIFAVAWVLFFAALHLARRTAAAGVRTASSFAAVLFGLVSLAAGGLLLGRQSVVEDRLYGVVVDEGTARQGPGAQYPSVAAVLPGVKVRLGGEEGDWRQVILPDGGGAWMPAEAVRSLRRP